MQFRVQQCEYCYYYYSHILYAWVLMYFFSLSCTFTWTNSFTLFLFISIVAFFSMRYPMNFHYQLTSLSCVHYIGRSSFSVPNCLRFLSPAKFTSAVAIFYYWDQVKMKFWISNHFTASGEPPLLLAISVHCATREAIREARKEHLSCNGFDGSAIFQLKVPATMPVVKELCGLDNVERYLENLLSRQWNCVFVCSKHLNAS